MKPEMNMTYECFVRGAFSITKNDMIDRRGDPAELASTDTFSYDDIEVVKAATAYSMAIYRAYIINNYEHTDNESNDMDRLIREVINAADKITIFNLINYFKRDYVEKYKVHKWGVFNGMLFY